MCHIHCWWMGLPGKKTLLTLSSADSQRGVLIKKQKKNSGDMGSIGKNWKASRLAL